MGNSKKKEWVLNFHEEKGWVATPKKVVEAAPQPVQLEVSPKLHPPRVTGRVGFDEFDKLGKLVVAGRPTGKHGGQQGQHTTAFAVTAEAIGNALPKGCTEVQAQSRLAQLFANLETYPGVSDNDELDEEYRAMLDKMSDPKSWPEDTKISDALARYAEMRDALPGSTLERTAYSDTTGGGEPTALKALRKADAKAQTGNPAKPTREASKEVIGAFLTLLDVSALSKLSAEGRAIQAEIFLRSVAQAFPAAFNSDTSVEDRTVGKILCEALSRSLTPQDGGPPAPFDDLNWLAEDCSELAETMALEEGMSRSSSEKFGAALEPTEDGFVVKVQGRPDSVTESGSQGNHMTSYRTMTRAVGAMLLEGGKLPTAAQLYENAQELSNKFKSEDYLALFPGLSEAFEGTQEADIAKELGVQMYKDGKLEAYYEISKADIRQMKVSELTELIHEFELEIPDGTQDERKPAVIEALFGEEHVAVTKLIEGNSAGHASYAKRLIALDKSREELMVAIGDKPKGGDAGEIVTPDRLLDIAELCIAMCDQRPSSVVYSGVASGHSEGYYGGLLDDMEAKAANAETPQEEEAFALICKQIDIGAIKEINEKFGLGAANSLAAQEDPEAEADFEPDEFKDPVSGESEANRSPPPPRRPKRRGKPSDEVLEGREQEAAANSGLGSVDGAVFRTLVLKEFCVFVRASYPNVVKEVAADDDALMGMLNEFLEKWEPDEEGEQKTDDERYGSGGAFEPQQPVPEDKKVPGKKTAPGKNEMPTPKSEKSSTSSKRKGKGEEWEVSGEREDDDARNKKPRAEPKLRQSKRKNERRAGPAPEESGGAGHKKAKPATEKKQTKRKGRGRGGLAASKKTKPEPEAEKEHGPGEEDR